ncbi:F-box domain [Arabidopsis suecica]|uniref:F-box domain n=1 Tax=Arabidopsis suecica TaxID=45249 RepID=A0A8T2CFK3_ARASU|nr:F-box domain [Arabidopsis suecica]
MTMICDLPPELVGKIFTKIPITSLRTVRSTCKLWNALTKEWVLGKAVARQPGAGFMTRNSRVLSVRFDLQGIRKTDGELVDPSIKQLDVFNQVEIIKVFHCHGLLLCILKDKSRLVVWNPYLGQTRRIRPRTDFHRYDRYALGYDINHNHKILRFLDDDQKNLLDYEIYDLSSKSWRVLKITPDWYVYFNHRGVSVNGNTYFFAHEKEGPHGWKDFLLCFDFTKERFGPRLPLPSGPSEPYNEDTVTLSCVREEQLAVLYEMDCHDVILEIWVTTRIESNALSWSKFLKVDMTPHLVSDSNDRFTARFNEAIGSFFIDEEEKVALVFGVDGYVKTKTTGCPTAFISGEDGYFKTVSLRGAPNVKKSRTKYFPPLVCSSFYLPSLVQINKPRKRKKRDN